MIIHPFFTFQSFCVLLFDFYDFIDRQLQWAVRPFERFDPFNPDLFHKVFPVFGNVAG